MKTEESNWQLNQLQATSFQKLLSLKSKTTFSVSHWILKSTKLILHYLAALTLSSYSSSTYRKQKNETKRNRVLNH